MSPTDVILRTITSFTGVILRIGVACTLFRSDSPVRNLGEISCTGAP